MTCKTCGWKFADESTQNKIDPTIRVLTKQLAEAYEQIGYLKAEIQDLKMKLSGGA